MTNATQAKISIIIPVWNEATIIEAAIARLQSDSGVEIIVADGGSTDQTVEVVKTRGVKFVSTPLGKAQQMNQGAAVATGEILLFLHVDTRLPLGYQQMIRQTLASADVVAGAFELGIDSPRWQLRIVEMGVKWRSRFFSLPYGDQGIFLRAKMFQEIGGFAPMPIMEDFELVQRLKRRGKIAIAPAKVLTSPRRWHKLGAIKTTVVNQLIILGYYAGVSPEKLRQWYRNL